MVINTAAVQARAHRSPCHNPERLRSGWTRPRGGTSPALPTGRRPTCPVEHGAARRMAAESDGAVCSGPTGLQHHVPSLAGATGFGLPKRDLKARATTACKA